MYGFYLATALKNSAERNVIRDTLTSLGYVETYDWTVHGDIRKCGADAMTDTVMKEMDGIRRADFVVVMLPGGRGTHAEIGIAMALDRRTFIIGDSKYFADDGGTSIFYWGDRISRYTRVSDALKVIAAEF